MLADRVIEMPAAIRSGRFYCNVFFFAAGVGIGSWASCLPVLSAQNSLEKGELGLILLCFALGAIVAMTNVGRLTSRYSCSALSLGGALTFGTALVIVPFVSGNAWLASIVFVAGSGFGTLDVSMNTDASGLERRSGRHLMSSFHAMFSFGNLAGAFTVGQILSHGGALAICLGATGVGVSTFAIVASLGSSRNADPADALQAGASIAGTLDRAQKAYLYLIGAIAFLSMLGEGGIMDWSAIYIVNVFSGTDSAGAYGFAVFATMMAFGRLFGDAITTRIGSTRLLYYCSIICAASVGLLVLAANVVVVFLALGLCGLSVANLVPLAFAAAGRSGGAFAGRAMSIVTTMGYAGLLLGPAVLGFVAQASSLSVTFMLIAAAFILVALATRALRKE